MTCSASTTNKSCCCGAGAADEVVLTIFNFKRAKRSLWRYRWHRATGARLLDSSEPRWDGLAVRLPPLFESRVSVELRLLADVGDVICSASNPPRAEHQGVTRSR